MLSHAKCLYIYIIFFCVQSIGVHIKARNQTTPQLKEEEKTVSFNVPDCLLDRLNKKTSVQNIVYLCESLQKIYEEKQIEQTHSCQTIF